MIPSGPSVESLRLHSRGLRGSSAWHTRRITMKSYLCFLTATVLLFCTWAMAGAPAGFTPFTGQMYGEANQGQPAHHSHQTLTVKVPHGMIIDTSAGGGNIACCGGDENKNAASTEVPQGIAVEPGGGRGGGWGVLIITEDTG